MSLKDATLREAIDEVNRLRAEIAALQRAIETTLADPLCDGWTLARLQNALGRSREATSSGAGAGEPPDGVRPAPEVPEWLMHEHEWLRGGDGVICPGCGLTKRGELLAGVLKDDLYGPVEK